MQTGRPKDLVALLDDLGERVRRLELAQSVSVGGWVLEERADGALLARHAASGEVTVVAPPAS